MYILARATDFFLSARYAGSLGSCPNVLPTLPIFSAILAAKLADSSSTARLAISVKIRFNKFGESLYCIASIVGSPLSCKSPGTINSRSSVSDRSPSSTLSSPYPGFLNLLAILSPVTSCSSWFHSPISLPLTIATAPLISPSILAPFCFADLTQSSQS